MAKYEAHTRRPPEGAGGAGEVAPRRSVRRPRRDSEARKGRWGNANCSCFSSLAVARQIITHNTTTVDSV